MKEFGPISKKGLGQNPAAAPYIPIARKLLGMMKHRMRLLGIPSLVWRRTLEDGTDIAVFSNQVLGGVAQDYISIRVLPEESDLEIVGSDIYMDVGCYFMETHGGLQTFPLDVYLSDDILLHLGLGYGDTEVVFMPGHENHQPFCEDESTFKYTKTDGITLLDTNHYVSPVIEHAGDGEFFNIAGDQVKNPPYRWTGHSRLWAQGLCGIGKLLDTDPDTTGLLISEDYRFYTAEIGSGDITITPMTPNIDDCTFSILLDAEALEEDKKKALVHVLATLVADDDNSYTIGDLSALDDTGSPAAYGWHWSYTDNECSIVNITPHATLPQWVTTLASIVFTIPTAEDEDELDAQITAELTVEETSDFRQPRVNVWWVYLGDTVNLLTNARYHPVFGTEMEEGIGTDVAVYVFYQDTGRVVLRHTKNDPAANWVVPMPPKHGWEEWRIISCTAPYSETHYGHTYINAVKSGGWALDGATSEAQNNQVSGWDSKRTAYYAFTDVVDTRDYHLGNGSTPCTGDIPEHELGMAGASEFVDRESWNESRSYNHIGGMRVVIMVPRNPDGLYFATKEAGIHTNYSRSAWGPSGEGNNRWRHTVDGRESNDQRYVGYVCIFQLGMRRGSVDLGSESDSAQYPFDDRGVNIAGVTFEATATGGSELSAYLRTPVYNGDNTTEAGKVISESYGGIAPHNYGTQTGFPHLHTDKLMRFAGWA